MAGPLLLSAIQLIQYHDYKLKMCNILSLKTATTKLYYNWMPDNSRSSYGVVVWKGDVTPNILFTKL
jgi:hypothetical protein